MTRCLLLSVAPLLALAACTTPIPAPVPTGTSLFGRWKLVKMVGGFTGRIVSYPASPIIDLFTPDSTYQSCSGGRCTPFTQYYIRTERSYISGRPERILTIMRRVFLGRPDTGSVLLKDRFRINEVNTRLTIAQDGPESDTYFYSRL